MCTGDGWSPVSIDYTVDCGYDLNNTVVDDNKVSSGVEVDVSA